MESIQCGKLTVMLIKKLAQNSTVYHTCLCHAPRSVIDNIKTFFHAIIGMIA